MTSTHDHKEMIMHEYAEHEAQNESFTAMVCEQAALFGATPGPDEFDNRPVWDKAEATAAVIRAFHLLAEAAPDGTQLADERRNLLWGFVNTLDAQTQRLDRAADKLIPGIRDLQREQDGSEIRSRELELATDRAQQPHPSAGTPSKQLQGHSRRGLPRRRPARCGGRGEARTFQPDRQADFRRHRGARLPAGA